MMNVINIGDLINLKIHASQETLMDISKRFVNTKKSNNYDFEITKSGLIKLAAVLAPLKPTSS